MSSQNSSTAIILAEQEISHAVANITHEHENGRLTFERALQGRQLSTYKRLSEQAIIVTLSVWISQLSSSFNIGKNIAADQVLDIAKTILRDHQYLKLSQLYLFFQQASKGLFGQVYDRLDKAVILDWLLKFENKSDEELEGKRISGLAVEETELEKLEREGKKDSEEYRQIEQQRKEGLKRLKNLLAQSLRKAKEQKISEKKELEQMSREERERRLIITNLYKWFPNEMMKIGEIVNFWLDRREETTMDEMLDFTLNSKRVKILIEKMEKAQQSAAERQKQEGKY